MSGGGEWQKIKYLEEGEWQKVADIYMDKGYDCFHHYCLKWNPVECFRNGVFRNLMNALQQKTASRFSSPAGNVHLGKGRPQELVVDGTTKWICDLPDVQNTYFVPPEPPVTCE